MAVIYRNEQERRILKYVYDNFHMYNWFRGAGIVDIHPLTKEEKKVLVINCNFKPFLDFFNIKKILEPIEIQERMEIYWREVDENGNDKLNV